MAIIPTRSQICPVLFLALTDKDMVKKIIQLNQILKKVKNTIFFNSIGGSQEGFCQVYRGATCAKFLANRTIFVQSSLTQGIVEEKLAAAFTVIAHSGYNFSLQSV